MPCPLWRQKKEEGGGGLKVRETTRRNERQRERERERERLAIVQLSLQESLETGGGRSIIRKNNQRPSNPFWMIKLWRGVRTLIDNMSNVLKLSSSQSRENRMSTSSQGTVMFGQSYTVWQTIFDVWWLIMSLSIRWQFVVKGKTCHGSHGTTVSQSQWARGQVVIRHWHETPSL